MAGYSESLATPIQYCILYSVKRYPCVWVGDSGPLVPVHRQADTPAYRQLQYREILIPPPTPFTVSMLLFF